jgi:RimJ/RimL family protein N-acetyltransferase
VKPSIPNEPLITDGVVTLARFESADVSTMVDGDADPELRRRFEFPSDFVASAEHSAAVLAKWDDDWVRGEPYTLAVRDSVDGTLLGGCELQPRPSGEANLSYWTYPAFRRRGVASRAVALLAKAAFEVFGVTTLEILTTSDNTASRKVALRSGFVPNGVRDGQLLFIAERSSPRS